MNQDGKEVVRKGAVIVPVSEKAGSTPVLTRLTSEN